MKTEVDSENCAIGPDPGARASGRLVRAFWQGQLIAESADTVIVEGNHYFPAGAVKPECLTESPTHTVCGWKGTASYHNVVVAGNENKDAAWYYPEPKSAAAEIKGRIAFWKGVKVVEE